MQRAVLRALLVDVGHRTPDDRTLVVRRNAGAAPATPLSSILLKRETPSANTSRLGKLGSSEERHPSLTGESTRTAPGPGALEVMGERDDRPITATTTTGKGAGIDGHLCFSGYKRRSARSTD